MPTNRERFNQELARITGEDEPYGVEYDGLDCPNTAAALRSFARALNPDRARPRLRKPRSDGTLADAETTFGSAREYLQCLRLIHERGFDLLGGSAEDFNDFMLRMVDGSLPDYGGSIQRTTAGKYQSAARAFYRFCDETGKSAERPETVIGWPADAIHVFPDQSEPRYDESDMFDAAEVDALREGCITTRNSRRDRALVEMLAGTVQRIEAVRTLRVEDVHTDPTEGPPYVLLNPEIRGDGDKGAIETGGRWRPIVSDVGPIREFLDYHPLRDADTRARHGCPDDFEACYLFVGDPTHPDTDASRPWDANAIRNVLDRLGERVGVSKPVKPHNFRHWAYSKSKELPIDESVRETVFGWSPGSGTGDTVYGHVEARQAGEAFAEAWGEAFGDSEVVAGVASQLIGDAVEGPLAPEAARTVVDRVTSDQEFIDRVADGVADRLR